MRFALVDNIKSEAIKGLIGLCPSCGSELVAKCGEQKINHWAHKKTRICDSWWEPETEWHRYWKNNYEIEWQEAIFTDEETGEKHIADVHTAHNLVIEFQHSFLKPGERISREKFYKNMVWVIDCTRLKRDFPRFLIGKEGFRKTEKKGIFLVDFIDEVFPEYWLNSTVPLIFDFKGLEATDKNDLRNSLYCLLPVRIRRYAIVAEISRKAFITSTTNGDWSLRIQKFIDYINRLNQEHIKQTTIQQQTRQSTVRHRRRGPLIDYIEKKQFSNRYSPKRKGRR